MRRGPIFQEGPAVATAIQVGLKRKADGGGIWGIGQQQVTFLVLQVALS